MLFLIGVSIKPVKYTIKQNIFFFFMPKKKYFVIQKFLHKLHTRIKQMVFIEDLYNYGKSMLVKRVNEGGVGVWRVGVTCL